MGEDSGGGDIPLTLTLSRRGRENYDVAIFKKGCEIASQALMALSAWSQRHFVKAFSVV